MVGIETDRSETADIFAPVSQTSSASVCDLIPSDGTFVTGNVNDFDDIRVVFISAHCEFDSFRQNCAFLVNTATHRRRFSGNDQFRNVKQVIVKSVFPRLSGDFSQYLVFKMLYLCVEFPNI